MQKKKKEVVKELESLAPALLKLKEQDSRIQVPEGYFRELPDTILDRIREMETANSPTSITHSWIDRLGQQLLVLFQARYAMALAAVMVLIVAVALLLPTGRNNSPNAKLAAITPEEARTYITAHIDEFDLELVVEAAGSLENMEALPGIELSGEESEELLDELLDELDPELLNELL